MSEQPDMAGLSQAVAALDKIARAAHMRAGPRAETAWGLSRTNGVADYCLIADGLGSRSTPILGLLPWLDFLLTQRQMASLPHQLRGFSYTRPGTHYAGADTKINLELGSAEKFAGYLPTEGCIASYVTFSLAGPLALLGLAEGVRISPDVLSRVRSIVLVQPAFRITSSIEQAAERFQEVPGPLQEYFDDWPDYTLRGHILHNAAELARVATITMLFWPGDRIVDYPASLVRQLTDIGIACTPLNLPAANPSSNPFDEHCAVARNTQTVAAIARLLSAEPPPLGGAPTS